MHRVMLIEDDQAITRLLVENLESRGLKVTAADNLACGICKLMNGTYDVIILDLQLPDSSGVETGRKILHLFPKTPLIIFTGSVPGENAEALLKEGVTKFLLKGPGVVTDLIEQLLRVIASTNAVTKAIEALAPLSNAVDTLAHLPTK